MGRMRSTIIAEKTDSAHSRCSILQLPVEAAAQLEDANASNVHSCHRLHQLCKQQYSLDMQSQYAGFVDRIRPWQIKLSSVILRRARYTQNRECRLRLIAVHALAGMVPS